MHVDWSSREDDKLGSDSGVIKTPETKEDNWGKSDEVLKRDEPDAETSLSMSACIE